MSVQAALDFLQATIQRSRETQTPLVEPLTDDLQEVVLVGRQKGYEFTADDLRAAFRHDWQRRWRRFSTAAQG